MNEMKSKVEICVIGLGYIGLPAAVFAVNAGYSVVGVDINGSRLSSLREAICPIDEVDFRTEFDLAINSGHFAFSEEIIDAGIYIICVPTPIDSSSSKQPKPDIAAVISVAQSIAKVVKNDALVIVESTCPVGTTDRIADILVLSGDENLSIHVAYCPERLLPGNIVQEFLDNPRVIGGVTETAGTLAANYYKTVVRGTVSVTRAKVAEMCKLVENSFRDVNIAFANEISKIAIQSEISPEEVVALANMHPRVSILRAGIGVGGHCIAVDPWFLASASAETRLLVAARRINDDQPLWITRLISEEVGKINNQKPLLVLGQTYKADVPDLRESPAVEITNALMQSFDLEILDPVISKDDEVQIVAFEEDPSLLMNYRAVIVLVDHQRFSKIRSIVERSGQVPYFVAAFGSINRVG